MEGPRAVGRDIGDTLRKRKVRERKLNGATRRRVSQIHGTR